MTLLECQQVFAVHVAGLLLQAVKMGYGVTLGEAYRPEVTAQYYAQHKEGIAHSLHTQRLALDINLFKGTEFLTSKLDYQSLGLWWEAQSTSDYKLCWGGNFSTPDSDHFSLAFDGKE